ncbi:MAG: glycosyltransferase [Deltaproteobacteria bacterium]|nr:glycosyltransferase [Deltaproteobacteria bacterium]
MQLLQILRDYDHSRFHMDVACFGAETGYLAREAKKLDADVLHCPKSANLYLFSKRFHKLIGKREYDVVHCHSEAWSGPILRGAKHAEVPVKIAHIRINLPQGFRIENPILKLGRNFLVAWGRYWLLKYASHILSVSAAALDSRFPRWREKDNFSLWTLGVDTRKFSLQSERNMGQGKKPVIINVASFSPQKRQDSLLRIYALVLDRLPEAKLILVGEGTYLERCKGLAKRLGCYDRVDFLGLREDIPDLLHGADMFVSCSEAEGLPNVLLEAQASGLPVVASDIPPHREALHDTAHQFLFPHDDIQGAVDNIVRILNEPHLYNRLSEAGRAHVCRYYDSKKNLPKLEELYLEWVEEGDS